MFIGEIFGGDNCCACEGEWAPSSAAANFTPHIITVNAGEVIRTI